MSDADGLDLNGVLLLSQDDLDVMRDDGVELPSSRDVDAAGVALDSNDSDDELDDMAGIHVEDDVLEGGEYDANADRSKIPRLAAWKEIVARAPGKKNVSRTLQRAAARTFEDLDSVSALADAFDRTRLHIGDRVGQTCGRGGSHKESWLHAAVVKQAFEQVGGFQVLVYCFNK